jgi:Domain of unknown function (DUF1818)
VGLVGTEEWAIELTELELRDFCRLARELAAMMAMMGAELMDEESLAVELESDQVWMEVEGFPSGFGLRFMLSQGRGVEGEFLAAAVPGLLQGLTQIEAAIQQV